MDHKQIIRFVTMFYVVDAAVPVDEEFLLMPRYTMLSLSGSSLKNKKWLEPRVYCRQTPHCMVSWVCATSGHSDDDLLGDAWHFIPPSWPPPPAPCTKSGKKRMKGPIAALSLLLLQAACSFLHFQPSPHEHLLNSILTHMVKSIQHRICNCH